MAESQARKTAEPEKDGSMEEILQSIRRIIAEEDDAPVASTPANNSGAVGSSILELTEMVEEDGSVVSLAETASIPPMPQVQAAPPPPPAAPARAPDVLSSIDSVLSNPQPAPVSMLAPDVEQAAAAAFRTALASGVPQPASATRAGTTVEDLVVASMYPMLKQWLDANLPSIVERVVEREVRRVSENARGA